MKYNDDYDYSYDYDREDYDYTHGDNDYAPGHPYARLRLLVAFGTLVGLGLLFAPFLLAAVLFSSSAEAATPATPTTEAIYYIDASFSGCDTMTLQACNVRTESHMHALAALANIPIQTDSLSGAHSADFIDAFDARLDWWAKHSSPQGAPKHVIVGMTNDVWRRQDRHFIVDMVRYISDTLCRVSPESILYVVDYPPVAGLAHTNSSHLIRDPEQFEADRAWYRKWAKTLPNTVVIEGVWDGWHGSGVYHPAFGAADYHPDSRTAMLAALRMMEAVLAVSSRLP
jgi:hypothetical protein